MLSKLVAEQEVVNDQRNKDTQSYFDPHFAKILRQNNTIPQEEGKANLQRVAPEPPYLQELGITRRPQCLAAFSVSAPTTHGGTVSNNTAAMVA